MSPWILPGPVAGPAAPPPVLYVDPDHPNLQDALSLLQENLPTWWRTDDPTSILYGVLVALAHQIDGLYELFEDYLRDQALATSTLGGLERTWMTLWGVQNEQLALNTGTIVPYIQARAQENGTPNSLLNTLRALFMADPSANTVGTIVTFPSGGGGLTFPASGGITLWQWNGTSSPLPSPGVMFPLDGSGLIFPEPPVEVYDDEVIMANDGTSGITGYANYPLTFSNNDYVVLIQDFANHRYTVQVKAALAFDRGAFARAVQRFRPASCFPPLIQEVP